MTDPASGSWTVYNGEIYNHLEIRARMSGAEFVSTCDTETLLKLWAEKGPAALDSLRGMFAFALWDARRQELSLVRDRLGIKPLYVAKIDDGGTWVFASELRTILASGLVPRKLDREALSSYLAFGSTTAPWTLVEGVESLLPAETWKFDLKPSTTRLEPTRERYWRPTFNTDRRSRDRRADVDRVRQALLKAASSHMLSDVPVALFLSGGIDSSGLLAALAHEGHRPKTFSVRFGESDFDESRFSRQMAERFDTEHFELLMPHDKVAREFATAVAAYDQPSADGINTYFLTEAVVEAGVKVAMSGLGGDELFAGYPGFQRVAWLANPLRRAAMRLALSLVRRKAPEGIVARKLSALLETNGTALANYIVLREVMSASRRRDLLQDGSHARVLPPELAAELDTAVAELGPVQAQSLLELSLYMNNTLLRDSDQMSMAHSLELRVPFLDQELVEAVCAVPGPEKLSGPMLKARKQLLLDALPVRLDEELARRPKMGFVFPWQKWLKNELRPLVDEVLSDRTTIERAGLDPTAVDALNRDFQASRGGVRATDVLTLMHLLVWVRRHELHA